jgi:hypothetical protein
VCWINVEDEDEISVFSFLLLASVSGVIKKVIKSTKESTNGEWKACAKFVPCILCMTLIIYIGARIYLL